MLHKMFFISAVVLQLFFVQIAEAAGKKALVYRGRGGCTSCANAAARAVRAAGLQVEFVGSAGITPEVFKDVVLWVQPAGNAITVAETMGADRLALLREFVKNGGNYVGFCSGAFLADKNVDDEGKVKGLGLISFPSADYIPVEDDETPVMVWMNWNGERRHVFFNGGATFNIPPSKRRSVRIIATYEKDDMPATIEVIYGQGRVVLSGAHPEAPLVWKDRWSLKDEDGTDMVLAKKMVQLAMQK